MCDVFLNAGILDLTRALESTCTPFGMDGLRSSLSTVKILIENPRLVELHGTLSCLWLSGLSLAIFRASASLDMFTCLDVLVRIVVFKEPFSVPNPPVFLSGYLSVHLLPSLCFSACLSLSVLLSFSIPNERAGCCNSVKKVP